MFDCNRLVGMKLFDGEKELGAITTFGVDGKCRRIYPVLDGEKTVAGKIALKKKFANGEEITEPAEEIFFICGKPAFDTDGKLLGNVSAIFSDRSMRVKKIAVGNTDILPSSVLAARDCLLIKIKQPKRNRPEKAAAEPKKQTRLPYPMRKSGDFSFLLGRKCDKNVTNFQGETMIRCGDVITKEILRQAAQSGKLIELSLHCY